MNRNLQPLTEDQIFEILRRQDKNRGTPPQMNDTEFLLELYSIVPLGKAICSTDQAAAILNLRVQREGIRKSKPYSGYSIRQKVFDGSHHADKSKKTEEEKEREYEENEEASSLFPLTSDEQRRVFGATVGTVLFFLVKDILTVHVTRASIPGRYERRRPKNVRRSKRGRPVETNKTREIKKISRELLVFYEENDMSRVEAALKRLDDTVHSP